MRKKLFGTCVYAALAAASWANAQSPLPITLENASRGLTGPWAFHTGDDPAWSNPRFDDSSWERVELSAAAGAHDADVGLSGYVKGWGARGHLGVSGYGWYRIRMQLKTPADQQLAIAGPPAVDSAYQVFWNGRLLGGVGNFSSAPPRVFSIQPRMFTISPATSAGGTDRSYGTSRINEQYRCSYGPNPAYESTLFAGDLRATARDEAGHVHGAELAGHPFSSVLCFSRRGAL